MGVLKGTAYTVAALIAISVVAAGSLVFLAVGSILVVALIGGLFVWFVAALIKEHLESRALRK